MFEHPETTVTVLLALAALGLAVCVLSVRRRRKIRGLCARAAEAIEHGRHEDALQVLVAAERVWAFNSHDGSRSSLIADLDDFAVLLGQFSRLPPGRVDPSCISQLEALVTKLRGLFSDRDGFGIDGRSMKRDTATQWSELSGRFETIREELRKSYQ